MTPATQSAAQIVLGLETSCDETAAAVVRLDTDGTVGVLSSVVGSQIAAHAPYGGVVPEIAARAHVETIDGITARALAEAFWPGPLTLVLPVRREAGIASLVTAGLDTIAIRVPHHRAMQALIAATARPLAAPSANASGAISPTRAAHVAASLGKRVPMIIDDGACPAGVESTIVAGRAILRPGPISTVEISRVLGMPIERPAAGPRPLLASGEPVTAPGQLLSHYAPSKPLRLNADARRDSEYFIGFGSVEGDENLSVRGDMVEAAANLFDSLHRADASSHARIAVAPIPETGIGAAIADRLARAAHR